MKVFFHREKICLELLFFAAKKLTRRKYGCFDSLSSHKVANWAFPVKITAMISPTACVTDLI